jgi:hypothetical protein
LKGTPKNGKIIMKSWMNGREMTDLGTIER